MPDMWFKAYSRNSNSHFGSEVLTDDAESKVTGVSMYPGLIHHESP